MKKITFLIFLLSTVLAFGQSLPVDFEDGTTAPQFQFGNLGFGNIVNPDQSGLNVSTRVLEINKPDSADWFGGIGFETPGLPLVDLANGTEFTMKVWAPTAGQSIRFQIQNGLSGEPTYNRDVVINSAMTWVEVSFDFTSQPGLTGTEQYPIIVIQPNYDPACEGASPACTTVGTGNGGIWYIDDIVQVGAVVDPNEDASLSDLTIDAVTVSGFSPNTLTYDVELPNGTTMAPTVAGVATQAGNGSSNVSVTQASGVPGSATVDVTAPNGVDMQTYTVNFTEAPALPPAAPTPPSIPSISIISDVFTNVTVPQVDTFGGTLTNFDLNTDGNEEARLITGGSGFQFNFFPGNAFIDISPAGFLHLDVYCDNLADNDILRIRLLDPDPGVNGANIARYEFSAAQAGTWVSIDLEIPNGTNLNDFGDIDSASSPVDLTNLSLIQFNTLDLGSGLASKEVYISNVYFYGGTLSTLDVEATIDFKVFPNPTQADWSISSSNIINSIAVYDILGKQVLSLKPNSNQVVLDASSLRSGIYITKIEGENGTKTVKLVKN
ncbi:T9SS type A sorting domain-containing protein [Winogradskyella sp. MH6]|uniref:T9SS type A sorting domain-containing protein n=1 Tax=Winogradskyella sp. MH6 TaxID=2929510 RepID=UPI001FB25C89|nr:T9SS type A sorting domain-containing protein [Winogradskyella sp. MH6]